MSERPVPELEFNEVRAAAGSRDDFRRRRYAKPRLEHYGDVRGLTMGGSPGVNDSGAPAVQDPFSLQRPPFPPSR